MEKKKVYDWKLMSFAKGIDAEIAVQEFGRIESVFGALTPENIVEASKDEDAVFHKLFDWNDSTAAHKYRLQQARQVINNIEVRLVTNEQEKIISAYEIVKSDTGNQYKRIDNLTTEDIDEVKKRVVQSLNYFKNQLSTYRQFDFAAMKIDEAINHIKEA